MPRISNSNVKTSPSKIKNGTEESEAWPEDKSKSKQKLDEFERMEIEIKKEIIEKEKKKENEAPKKKRRKNPDMKNGKKKETYEHKENEPQGKHVGPRVRSFDATKMKSKFNKTKESSTVSNECRVCGKPVFQMEKIVAEKAAWHKNCFRCKECNKFLSLENYQSHEGSVYCQPHFKELFRPKAVMQSEEDERLEKLSRKPRMIVLESNPISLPEDIVRATAKPDYGLEELQETLNVRERFEIFENFNKDDEEKLPKEPILLKRTDSLMARMAKFMENNDSNSFGEEEEEDDSTQEDQGDGEDENGPRIVRNTKKKERPMSFSGMGDLKAAWEQKQRREEMSQARKEEVAKFRQLLCAGKNLSLKEKFESGEGLDGEETPASSLREEIRIEGKRAASTLRKRFEEGAPFVIDEDDVGEKTESEAINGNRGGLRSKTTTEVDEIFKHADTAKQARNVFKQIDCKVLEEGHTVMRSPSATIQNKRLSLEVPRKNDEILQSPEVVKASDKNDDFQVNTADLANKFKFFLNYEQEQEKERNAKKSAFRITPPREGIDHVVDSKQESNIIMPKPCMAVNCEACKLRREDPEALELLGRDPNLIKCTDNYQDEIDCRNTKNILQMFKNMEMSEENENIRDGPRPLKRFTPPLDSGECGDTSDDEYSDEYTDDEDDESDNALQHPAIRDEILQMLSAKKAAELRAKFERWEANEDSRNGKEGDEDDDEEHHMPSLDKARNLRAMFENKANESANVTSSKPTVNKINRFV